MKNGNGNGNGSGSEAVIDVDLVSVSGYLATAAGLYLLGRARRLDSRMLETMGLAGLTTGSLLLALAHIGRRVEFDRTEFERRIHLLREALDLRLDGLGDANDRRLRLMGEQIEQRLHGLDDQMAGIRAALGAAYRAGQTAGMSNLSSVRQEG